MLDSQSKLTLQGLYKAVFINEHSTKCHFKNIDGKHRVSVLPVTKKQVVSFMYGASAQTAFPNLSSEQRELFISGFDQEDWDRMVSDSED